MTSPGRLLCSIAWVQAPQPAAVPDTSSGTVRGPSVVILQAVRQGNWLYIFYVKVLICGAGEPRAERPQYHTSGP